MRTDMVEAVLPFGRVLGPDHAFLVLLAVLGEFVHVPRPLFTYRMQEHLKLWPSRQLNEYYQRAIEPNAKWRWKYYGFLATASHIISRVAAMEISRNEKIRIMGSTVAWWLNCEVSKPVQQRVLRLAKGATRRLKR